MDGQQIEWTLDYQFKVDDFKLSRKTSFSAHHGTSLTFNVDIDEDILFENPRHAIRAIFNPESSWLDPSTDFEKAFKVAKMGFDFAEMLVREIRKSLIEDDEISELPEYEYQIDSFRLLILEPLQEEYESRWQDVFAKEGYLDSDENILEVQQMITTELNQLNEFQYSKS